MSGGYEIVVWALLIVGSITDLLFGKIYNHLTLSAILAGVIFRFILQGPQSALSSGLGILAGFLLFFPLYSFHIFAAGDVKLLMALGSWAKPEQVIQVGLLAIPIGGAVGLVVLLHKKRTQQKSPLSRSQPSERRNPNPSPTSLTRMPFGPAFLCSYLFLKIAEMKGWSVF